MAVQYDHIPLALRERDQWVCWALEEREGKRTKIPIAAATGKRASSTDPSTWAGFDEARAACERNGYSGIGFVFADDRAVTGVDLDHVLDAHGNLAEEYAWVASEADTYTEVSPSGDGLHLFFLNGKPDGAERCKRDQGDGTAVEMYDHGRFFTVTGNVFIDADGLEHVEARSNAKVLEKIYDAYLAGKAKSKCRQLQREEHSRQGAVSLDDTELLEKMFRAKNGDAARRLWDGDTSGHNGDASAADLALCNQLAFWTGGDAFRMDALFRQSGLMRSKWDERHGAKTYGEMTIDRAIGDAKAFYDPRYSEIGYILSDKERRSETLEGAEFVPRNDKDYSRFFAKWLAGKVVFVPEEKSFRIWDGTHWVKDGDSLQVSRMCKTFVDDLVHYAQDLKTQDEDGKTSFVRFAAKYNKLSERKKLIEDVQCEVSMPRGGFDANQDLLNLRNCTLDLKTLETKPHDPDDYITKIANVTFDAQATCEEWEHFLNDALGGNGETIRFLQVVAGMSLTCDTSQECMFLLLGKTRSGKSTTVETIMEMLGPDDDGYAKSCNPETFASKRNDDSSRPSSDIARLNGCRLLVTSEPPKNMPFNVSRLKQLTGRDTITARFLHENEVQFKPTFTLIMAANNAPRVNDATLFESDRVYVIPFDRHLEKGERDTGLKDRLTEPESLSGILNWCLAGLRRYQSDGLIAPLAVVAATKEYADDSDKISLFVNECLVREQDASMTGKHAYQTFREWCSSSGHFAEGKTAFFADLRKRGLLAEQGTVNGRTYRNVILGYRAEGYYIE